MKLYSLTHKGRQRRDNEDCVYHNSSKRIIAVADGVGGHSAGEYASNKAVSALKREFLLEPKIITDKYISGVVKKINDLIFSLSLSSSKLEGMGSTLVFALLRKNRIFIANLGDSRAYLFRGSKLKQVTVDHSHVQELLDRGEISPEEAKRHPFKSVITKCLGSRISENPDVFEISALPGDLVMLCSDGLTNMANDEEIAQTLAGEPNLKSAAKSLIRKANNKGGSDNISVALMSIEKNDITE